MLLLIYKLVFCDVQAFLFETSHEEILAYISQKNQPTHRLETSLYMRKSMMVHISIQSYQGVQGVQGVRGIQHSQRM